MGQPSSQNIGQKKSASTQRTRRRTVMTGIKKLDDHVREIRREAGSTHLIFPLIKFKIWRNLMNCSSCSLFSASRAAILGSQPNSLIMRKMPIAVEDARQRQHNTDMCLRPHFR